MQTCANMFGLSVLSSERERFLVLLRYENALMYCYSFFFKCLCDELMLHLRRCLSNSEWSCVLGRCVRPDQSAVTMRMYYMQYGSASLGFS